MERYQLISEVEQIESAAVNNSEKKKELTIEEEQAEEGSPIQSKLIDF